MTTSVREHLRDQYSPLPPVTFTYRSRVPLNNFQKKTLQRIENHKLEGAAFRAVVYISKNPSVLLWNYEVDRGVDPTNLTGANAGLVGMYCASTPSKIKSFDDSQAYKEWSKIRNSNLAAKAACSFLTKDAHLQYFTCPISGLLPRKPVRFCGTSTVFDWDALQNWGNHHPGELYPDSGMLPTIHNVEFDYAHAYTILDRLHELFNDTLKEVAPLPAMQYQLLSAQLKIHSVVSIIMDYVDVVSYEYVDIGLQREVIKFRKNHFILENLNQKILQLTNLIKLEEHLQFEEQQRTEGPGDELHLLASYKKYRKRVVHQDSKYQGFIKNSLGLQKKITLQLCCDSESLALNVNIQRVSTGHDRM